MFCLCFMIPGRSYSCMLTHKQHDLLLFIHERIKETGVSPSFNEMKGALNLASKSGIHRLITALGERGFVRRLPNRARALEVIRLPDSIAPGLAAARKFSPSVIEGNGVQDYKSSFSGGKHAVNPEEITSIPIPVMGRIAAGVPISAIQHETHALSLPAYMIGAGEHYALEVKGDSMIDAGIFDGDTVIIRRTSTANPGEIVVALVDDEEATLKRYRRKGDSIALEAANPAYKTRIFGPNRIKIQGRLTGLIRQY